MSTWSNGRNTKPYKNSTSSPSTPYYWTPTPNSSNSKPKSKHSIQWSQKELKENIYSTSIPKSSTKCWGSWSISKTTKLNNSSCKKYIYGHREEDQTGITKWKMALHPSQGLQLLQPEPDPFRLTPDPNPATIKWLLSNSKSQCPKLKTTKKPTQK